MKLASLMNAAETRPHWRFGETAQEAGPILEDGLAPDFETEFDGLLGKAQIGGSIPPRGSTF